MSNGKFHVKTDAAGEYRFNLVAANGQVILSSEGYSTRASCMNGIDSVKRHAPREEWYERTLAANGRSHFNLKAANGEVIGTSQLYQDAQAMEKGMASVMSTAPAATVTAL